MVGTKGRRTSSPSQPCENAKRQNYGVMGKGGRNGGEREMEERGLVSDNPSPGPGGC